MAALVCSGCAHPAAMPRLAAHVQFVEVARKSGIDFRHFNGARGRKWMPETDGSGAAFLDYDNDGWQDILLINGTSWPGDPPSHTTAHLYHNDRNGSFTDVTAESGLATPLYGMGAAVGDFDNDGYEDLYITALGPNHLYRNTLGDGSRRRGPLFQDVTAQAGTAGEPVPGLGLKWKWSSSAAWLDYDHDGRLDLFVGNYVRWSPATDVRCSHAGGPKAYCTPDTYEGVPCTLYHNDGGGKFRDVSVEAGIQTPDTVGKSWGVATADYDEDGWPDLAVTNDTWPNFLFHNVQGRRFEERGVEAGIAFGETGKRKAGMGVDAADWNNSGHEGLIIGNFTNESVSLFSNDGHGAFTDVSQSAGMAAPTLLYLTFGAFFFDYDLDGWQDALCADGHIDDTVNNYESMVEYRERPLLFHNRGGTFEEVGEGSGAALREKLVARGAAYADIGNDGNLDFILSTNGGAARLYRNEGGTGNHWIGFRAEGTVSNRDGLGAVIRISCSGKRQQRIIHSGGSFLSESQRPAIFGLGSSDRIDAVEVRWPSGRVDRAGPLKADVQYAAIEGSGVRADPRITPGRA